MEIRQSPLMTSSSSKNIKINKSIGLNSSHSKEKTSMEILKKDKAPHVLLRSNNKSLPDHILHKYDRWQKIKNLSEVVEISGKEKKKYKDIHNTKGKWETLIEKASSDERIYYSKGVKCSAQKSLENSRSYRTLTPELDQSQSFRFAPSKKVNYDPKLKSSASGPIKNLLLVTPLYKQVFKPHSQKMNHENHIFNPELSYSLKRERSWVDLCSIRQDSSFAGVKSTRENRSFNLEVKPTLNYSRSRKLLSLSSDIFFRSFNNPSNNKKASNKLTTTVFPDRKNIHINYVAPLNFNVEVVDNTRKKLNMNNPKTRNLGIPTYNESTKVNSRVITKNQSRETLYKSNSSLLKF